MSKFTRMVRDNKGAALVEYALIVAGVALIGAAAVSVFGVRGGPGRAQGGAGGSGAGGATEGVVLMVRMEGWRAKRFEA